jgi:tRNA(Ile)-lysidine synthase
MAPFAPFAPAPRVVVGVSGGPHSLALVLLVRGWVGALRGAVLGAVCDHGLRAESAVEAAGVAVLLEEAGVAARVVPLSVPPGAAMQARARAARLQALLAACREWGAPWLLLGHHRGDQAETVLLRALAGSGAEGLAGMAPVRAADQALVLRPLLGVPPGRLEATVAAAGLSPVRDPSNRDVRFTRVRLRPPAARAEAALAEAATRLSARRAAGDAEVAARLAAACVMHPEGFARLDLRALGADAVAVAALRTLLRTVAGRAFAPPSAAVAALLARGEGTLGGAVLRRDGLLVREAAALGPAVPAVPGALWDGRFRLLGPGAPCCAVGALGAAAARFRRPAWLPGPALRVLPAAWRDKVLVAVPALAYPEPETAARFRLGFAPAGGAVT